MIRVTDAQYLADHRIRIAFSDGASGIVDLKGRLDGPIFEPLKDPQYLAAFEITGHTLEWPNGADFAPEYLRGLICDENSTNHAMQVRTGNDLKTSGGGSRQGSS